MAGEAKLGWEMIVMAARKCAGLVQVIRPHDA
jgi:hypothetical protein